MKRFAVAGLLLAVVAGAYAQNYPTRPIRFVVPYGAGGAGDIFARTIGQKLADAMGQAVVVDNRGGANGIIGTDLVAKAPPDGYTIVMANSAPFVLNPSLYSKLPYDAVRDFAPVTQGTYYGYVLVVHPSVAAKSVRELLALSRTKPIAFGSSGVGGANHLAGELFSMMTGVKFTHVPYGRGGAVAALADVLGGQMPMMFDTPITSIPLLKAGRLRALGFTGKRRAPQLPEVPTLDELGLKGYEVSSWQGIIAPAGTPRPVIDRLYAETVKALKLPDVIERLATQGGNELVGSTPDQYAVTIKVEIARYAKIIKSAAITLEK